MTTVAPAVAPPSQDGRKRTSPYQGLEPYSEEDAAYFFGRSAWREIIADHLCGYRVTVLYGASGVGKSSVLHAGVMDELRRQARRNSEVSGRPELLPVILSRWSSDPLVSLTDAIQSGAAAIAPELAEDPPQGSLAEVLTAWSERIGGHVLLILDQFDEYFTYYERSTGGSVFADELVEAIENRDVPAHFLFSIREDALAKLDLFEDRITDLWQNLLRIEHLDRAAAREAIEKPVERWNEREGARGEPIELEPGLVEAVLSEAEPESVHADKAGRGRVELTEDDGAGADLVEAPYLQLVMSRLWAEECGNGGRSIRVETLRRLGGGDRIFRSHFDSVMRSLPRRQRAVGARIFQYLVTPNGTKIALPPSALAKWAKQKESKVESVLKTLAGGERRILRTVSSAGDTEGETSYEIFHDRLASGILDWRRRYGRRRTIRRILTFAVPPLALALIAALVVIEMQRNTNAELDDRVRVFLVEAAARSSPNFGAMLPVHEGRVNSVAVSSDGRRFATAGDDGTVDVSRSSAEYGEFMVEQERTISVRAPSEATFSPDGQLLGIETPEARASVWGPKRRRFAIAASSNFSGLAFTPDGHAVLNARDDGTAELTDVRSGESIAKFPTGEKPLATALLSRDGRLLVTIGGSVARFWSVPEQRQLGAPLRLRSTPGYAAFAPDGRSLLTMSAGQTRLWQVANRQGVTLEQAGPRSRGEFGYDRALADFAPDGSFALAGRRDVPFFDRSGQQIAILKGHTTPTTAVRFSSDGSLLATGASGGGVRVWDVRTGRPRAVLQAHRGAVSSLAFGPDAALLVSGASDGTSILWLLTDLQRQVAAAAHRSPHFGAALPGDQFGVTSAAFSPDGRRVATAGEDRTVVSGLALQGGHLRVDEQFVRNIGLPVWVAFAPVGQLLGVETGDAWAGVWGPDGKKRFQIEASSDSISLAFTPDGRHVLTGLEDGTARLWDVRTGKSAKKFPAREKPLTTALLSRDGKLVVTIGKEVARIWDVGRRRQLGTRLRLSGTPVYAGLSPDGRWLLTVSPGDAVLWNTRSHRRVELEEAGPESGVDFSPELADFAPDGHFAIAGRRAVPLFDELGQRMVVLRGHTSPTTAVRFSRDGEFVATGDDDGIVRIWDSYGGQARAVLRAHLGPVSALAFSPDGKLLVTAASDGAAIVWRVPMSVG